MKTLTERTASALAWIDSQLAICNAATKCPWNDGWEIIGVTCDWQEKIPDSHAVVATSVGFSEGAAVAITSRTEDNAFIAAARTGYPAMLEAMKLAIETISYTQIDIKHIGTLEKILETILTRIEALQ